MVAKFDAAQMWAAVCLPVRFVVDQVQHKTAVQTVAVVWGVNPQMEGFRAVLVEAIAAVCSQGASVTRQPQIHVVRFLLA